MDTSIPLTRIALPGHHSPAAGFEVPFEMLQACHERVERMLRLLHRLQQHLLDHGWTADAAQAATDVMRYFDQAAPQHHLDEERHVFPPLLTLGDPVLQAVVERLQQDHRDMDDTWQAVRPILQRIAGQPAPGWQPLSAVETGVLARFAGLYGQHLQNEDQIAYPAARVQLSPDQLMVMSQDMMQRRGLVNESAS